MTDCIEPRWNELLGAYALGACTPDEQDGMREHMHRCPTCTAELLELGAAREALLTSVPRAAAPPELKSRVMQQVRADAELFAAAQGARERAGAGAAQPTRSPSAASGGAGGARRRRSPSPARAPSSSPSAAFWGERSSAARTAARRPPARCPRRSTPRRRPARAPGSSCRTSGGSQLVVTGMPSPGRGRVYEVWLLSGAGAPRPAGALFSVDHAGSGSAAVPGSLKGVDQVLVTSEPAGGSQQPTRDARARRAGVGT